jgi:hypothetical protein
MCSCILTLSNENGVVAVNSFERPGHAAAHALHRVSRARASGRAPPGLICRDSTLSLPLVSDGVGNTKVAWSVARGAHAHGQERGQATIFQQFST